MKWPRVAWAGLRHDWRDWHAPRAEGYFAAFDATVPKGFATYDDGSGSAD